MVLNQLISLLFTHIVKTVICSLKISFQIQESLFDFLLQLCSLIIGNKCSERKSFKISSYSDSCRNTIIIIKVLNFFQILIIILLRITILFNLFFNIFYLNIMVFFNNFIKKFRKFYVAILTSCINSYRALIKKIKQTNNLNCKIKFLFNSKNINYFLNFLNQFTLEKKNKN
jgi:hypothetical protein